jgi:beta-phosphoglucomutase-like phosphatase (HAD superfamily)
MDVPVLLFEFEGVLADTASMRKAALEEAFRADRILLTQEMMDGVVGYGTESAVRRLRRSAGAADDETAVELCKLRAERAFAERAGKGLNLQPGVRDALDRLVTTARCAIVTRASRREVEFVLGLAQLDGVFRPVIALEDATPSKPAGTPYFAALARIGQLFPGQQLRALALEDSLVGIRAARAAGLACVAVGPIPAYEAVEADAWVESLADLTPARVRDLTCNPKTGPQR